MFDKIVSVNKCPPDVSEALLEHGYTSEMEVTIEKAMKIWAEFHIGDQQWGDDACAHIAHMNSQHSIA